jgi:hypothetical protein
MHADLSRFTFRTERHYSAVLAQQGRVQLDADANEQTYIELSRARTLTADLIGQHGGPGGAAGFKITFLGGTRDIDDLTIGGGRYYVDGILLDASRPQPGTPVPDADTDTGDAPAGEAAGDGPAAVSAAWTYWDQPDAYRDPEHPGDRLPSQFPFVVYLKVWERSVTAAEDPALREVALGAAMPDTAARVKVVWQVLPLSALDVQGTEPGADEVRTAFRAWAGRQEASSARVALRAERPERADEDPCLVRPDARYRGLENQLYRVEIHDGGTAEDATFKWSRENGSVVFPVDGLDGTWVELASLGSDDKLDLSVGDRVEFVDSAYAGRLEPLPLLRVEELDLPGRRVRLSGEPAPGVGRRPELNPYLRRWDHRDGHRRTQAGAGARLRHGAVRVEEGRWLSLEDGVEVYFAKGGTYRTGDFWFAAARTATGGVGWPVDTARRPLLQAPFGVALHHAPLALITGEQGSVDLRLAFGPLAGAIPAATAGQLEAERQARDEEAAAEIKSGQNPRSQTTAGAEADAAPDADGDDEGKQAGQAGKGTDAPGGREGRRHG